VWGDLEGGLLGKAEDTVEADGTGTRDGGAGLWGRRLYVA
jgi:hypothetical protein